MSRSLLTGDQSISLLNCKPKIQVGHFKIDWCNAGHHLAYKRFHGIEKHHAFRGCLSEAYTSDLKQNQHFDIYTNDDHFVEMVKRTLTNNGKHLIFMKCVGCGENSAPTTDNVPIAWHSKCWIKCLGKHPQAADGYIKHLEHDLPRRIKKLLPNLGQKEFEAIHDTLSDIFWIQLHDLKTLGQYINKRYNDPDKIYSGICSFDLQHTKQYIKYCDYFMKLMKTKDSWYGMGIQYSHITQKSFMQNYNVKCTDESQNTNNKCNAHVGNSNKAPYPKNN